MVLLYGQPISIPFAYIYIHLLVHAWQHWHAQGLKKDPGDSYKPLERFKSTGREIIASES